MKNNFNIQINYYQYLSKNILLFLLNKLLIILVLEIECIYNFSEIHLIIKGNRKKEFLSSYSDDPSDVFINGILADSSSKKSCNLNGGVDNITLRFNFVITDCYGMFIHLKNIIIHLKNITEIDLSNFDFSRTTDMTYMFSDCKNLEKIYFGKVNTSSLMNLYGMFYGCSKLISLDISNFDTSKVTDMEFMFDECSSLNYLDLSNFNTQNVVNIRCMFYGCSSLVYLNLFSFKINSSVNIGSIFQEISPDVKYCINDIDTQKYLLTNGKKSNCNDKCFKDNIIIDKNTKECLESNNSNFIEEKTEDICKIDSNLNSDIISNFRKALINKCYFTIDNYEDFTLKKNNFIYTITSTENQKNNKNSNNTTINLGECENKLKEKFNISKNSSLYLLKVDAYFDYLNFPKIEYEVYYKFSQNGLLEKLDLSVCKNIKIEIEIPINITINELDKYNMSSDLYNDICYTFTSESGTDKPLKDRQNEFINNNMSVCEENCDFYEYDNFAKRAKCSCFTKINFPLISQIKFDKKKLLSNFKDIRNIANFKILYCIYLLFNKSNIFKNSANYIFIIIFIISVVSIFIFIFHDREKIRLYTINQSSKSNIQNNNINKITSSKRKNVKKRKKSKKHSKKKRYK